jgi:hypothetical protein
MKAAGEGGVGQGAQCEYWLRYAEYLALLGSHERACVFLFLFSLFIPSVTDFPPRRSNSAQAYDTALQLSLELEKEEAASPPVSSAAKIVERTALLRRTALAAHVCSVLLQRKVRRFLLLFSGTALTLVLDICRVN